MNYYVYIRRSNGSTSLFLISVLSFVWIVQKSNNYFKKPCTPICWRINQGEITHRIDSKSQLFGPFRQNSEKHIEWLQKGTPPLLKKKTWLKYKTFYNLLRCELDLKILTSMMFPRVLTEGSEYLSQCGCINPISRYMLFCFLFITKL